MVQDSCFNLLTDTTFTEHFLTLNLFNAAAGVNYCQMRSPSESHSMIF